MSEKKARSRGGDRAPPSESSRSRATAKISWRAAVLCRPRMSRRAATCFRLGTEGQTGPRGSLAPCDPQLCPARALELICPWSCVIACPLPSLMSDPCSGVFPPLQTNSVPTHGSPGGSCVQPGSCHPLNSKQTRFMVPVLSKGPTVTTYT
jgi:hypothetical protein